MRDRDRLIELFKKIEYTPFPEMTMKSNLGNQFTDYALNCIVDELLANGVIVPPCKVGDDIWILRGDVKNGWETLKPTHAEKVTGGFNLAMLNCITGELPPHYFLTKEEAEEKLKELK